MKKDELDELDRLAAEKVMGAVADPDHPFGPYFEICGIDWQPTRNISQAWECLGKFHYYMVSVWQTNDDGSPSEFLCVVGRRDGEEEGDATAKTAPEAIVRSCLKARLIE